MSLEAEIAAYGAFADRIVASGVISDPWIDGEPRFREEPLFVSLAELRALHRTAGDVASVYDEAARICANEPSLLDDFFLLTPVQKLMWVASRPLWHGIARADVFKTRDGKLAICEINSDTPTGEPEAVVTSALAHLDHPDALDPNAGLRARFVHMIETMRAGLLPPDAPRTAGIVYPTEMTEDLPLVRLYHAWLREAGFEVVLGSPFNLDASGALMGTACSTIVRHYKTDWLGERMPVWKDAEPFPDPVPMVSPLAAMIDAVANARAMVVNPFGAVLTQNKRTMALMWERRDLFGSRAQAIIEAHVPETVRLEAMHQEQLAAERASWVLKSDYGCEGDEVVIGPLCTQAEWEEALDKAIPERFVAQRYFEAEVDAEGESINHGVFVIAGQPCGLYARLQGGATDLGARSVPALVRVRA